MSVPPLVPSTSVAREPANPAVVGALLRSLPAWLGIEATIVGYVTAAARLATCVARDYNLPWGSCWWIVTSQVQPRCT